jgi:hypothetical protein
MKWEVWLWSLSSNAFPDALRYDWRAQLFFTLKAASSAMLTLD